MTARRIIVTTGEPAGIGPDLALAAALSDWPCELVFAGDLEMLGARARLLGLSLDPRAWSAGAPPTPHRAGSLPVLSSRLAVAASPGRPDPANARYVLSLLDAAAQGCLSGEFAAMVTAPVQKSSINDAGIPFLGHTEYLAAKSGGVHPVMLLVAGNLRVALATTHLPLAEVPRRITRELLERTLTVLQRGLRESLGIEAPRMLVCGLNPHAGERGHLGREEMDVIRPAVEAMAARGAAVTGPVPADTAFTPASLEHVDAVLAMYHDQGLPVIKHAGFGQAVNVTLGLPFHRASVDHGTALELAGTGRADPGSLFEAIRLASRLGLPG
ncbi:MAG TPA: 4-hydroxythreonine-4-phosphate dehydrogenase PdxA [Steroidobacteraceae bacterium]|nr:4-hydroxythreonine-4-phosphate dehydrogenase PdxA [Steroidobacteraceae bacterium]